MINKRLVPFIAPHILHYSQRFSLPRYSVILIFAVQNSVRSDRRAMRIDIRSMRHDYRKEWPIICVFVQYGHTAEG